MPMKVPIGVVLVQTDRGLWLPVIAPDMAASHGWPDRRQAIDVAREFVKAEVAPLVDVLTRAMAEGHHADKCPVRYREPCSCWRAEALAAMGKVDV